MFWGPLVRATAPTPNCAVELCSLLRDHRFKNSFHLETLQEAISFRYSQIELDFIQ